MVNLFISEKAVLETIYEHRVSKEKKRRQNPQIGNFSVWIPYPAFFKIFFQQYSLARFKDGTQIRNKIRIKTIIREVMI